MIDRYTLPEMAKLWTEQAKFGLWLEIELLTAEAWAEVGKISKESAQRLRQKARFDVARIHEIEKTVRHDVIAFITSVGENVGEESCYLHRGLTSSDVVDTAFAVQLCRASDLLLADLDRLLEVLKERALEFRHTPAIGRTHGIHAEPITFGLKLTLWYDEVRRQRERLMRAKDGIAVGKLSGPVGIYGNIDPRIENAVCQRLGLKPSPISSQVISRDRHAEFFQTLALVGSTIEKIALEVRHLQRTEVFEAEESFGKGQRGSSAMPHKRNPVLAENLCGLARLLRGYAQAALESVPLWHERDISHSSVERVIGPDATILLDFMLTRLGDLLQNWKVYPEQMKKNLERWGGLVFSESVLTLLTSKGMDRNEAYEIVQRQAMATVNDGIDFKNGLLKDQKLTKRVTAKELEGCFSLEHHLRYVDTIFERVFGKKC
ncbi:MAG: adenylosuccinate lyase [Deltaproteobacteria bacterium]|nr:adenylosuccinate lyase [Deltaproteobacteria bacterium]